MEKFEFKEISGRKWLVDNEKAIVVISHGMAEHAERYDEFATFLNSKEIGVYAINQLGHGDHKVKGLNGHWEKNGFYECVDNIKKLVDEIKLTTKAPIFLFGHSMGSFISQEFIKKYGNSINGVILSGSSKTGALHKAGRFMSLFFFKKEKQNNALNNLSFGSYNKPFAPNRTEFDWLSRDEANVDKYIDDPLCGYVCTTGFFQEFMKGLANLNKGVKNIPLNLPIHIMSGAQDPVGEMGKGVKALEKMYKDHNIKDVDMILYEGGRHEMLNEINRKTVMNDIYIWINKHI